MEIDLSVDKHSFKSKPISNDVDINLYKNVPVEQFTLEECQDLFRQRLEALTFIKDADLSPGKLNLVTNSFRNIKSHVFKANCLFMTTPKQRILDHVSHMLLRLYVVYDTSLAKWFKSCESKLLFYRLRDHGSSLSASQLEAILKSFDFNFQRVIGTELSELYKENLIAWKDREAVSIFKVHFTSALKLIAKRSVSLKGGYAYLNQHDIISIIVDVFDKHLDEQLAYGRQHLNIDPQARALLDSLTMVYLEHQEKIDEEKRKTKMNNDGENNSPYRIDLNNLPEMVKHYPPCMRYMHESLMEDHHLKHQARLYYGAFLRSGGVDMDSAIEFWRREFTKKIPNEKFERDYKYNIRHLYGKEGHKKALTCFSCDKIINDNPPGPSEKHGCPFKHFDETHLKTMLKKHELQEVDIESLVQINHNKEYKLTCSHYFKFTKGELPTEPIKNPAHFFYESVRLANRPPPQEEDSTNAPIKEEEDKWDDEVEQ